jgi:hypothetical protein
MNRFQSLLRATDSRMNLPQPIKSRVLLEIAADLEGLCSHYLQQGLSEDESVARATERVDLSDEALQMLIEVHASPWSRITDRMSGRGLARWERIVLALVATMIAATAAHTMTTSRFFAYASPVVWAVMATAVIGLALIVILAYQFTRRRGAMMHRRGGLNTVIFIAALAFFLGPYTIVLELYRALGIGIEANMPPNMSIFMLRVSPVMIVSLAVAVVLAVAWFFLAVAATHHEQRNASALIGNESLIGGSP